MYDLSASVNRAASTSTCLRTNGCMLYLRLDRRPKSGPASSVEPRSGVRMQPTAQAVGRKWNENEPQRGEREATTQTPKGRHEFSLALFPAQCPSAFTSLL